MIVEIVKHKLQEILMYGTRRDVHLEHIDVLRFQHFQKRPKLSGFIFCYEITVHEKQDCQKCYGTFPRFLRVTSTPLPNQKPQKRN